MMREVRKHLSFGRFFLWSCLFKWVFLRRSHPPAECYVLDTCCVSSRKPGTNGGLLCGRAQCCSLGYCELLLRVCAQVSESAVFILLNLIPLKAIGANKDFNTCFYCTLFSVPSCPLIPFPHPGGSWYRRYRRSLPMPSAHHPCSHLPGEGRVSAGPAVSVRSLSFPLPGGFVWPRGWSGWAGALPARRRRHVAAAGLAGKACGAGWRLPGLPLSPRSGPCWEEAGFQGAEMQWLWHVPVPPPRNDCCR